MEKTMLDHTHVCEIEDLYFVREQDAMKNPAPESRDGTPLYDGSRKMLGKWATKALWAIASKSKHSIKERRALTASIVINMSGEAKTLAEKMEYDVLMLENGVGLRVLVRRLRLIFQPNKLELKRQCQTAIWKDPSPSNPFSRQLGGKARAFHRSANKIVRRLQEKRGT